VEVRNSVDREDGLHSQNQDFTREGRTSIMGNSNEDRVIWSKSSVEIGQDHQVFQGNAPMQLMVSLKTGMADGFSPDFVGLAGDNIQGDKVGGHVVEQDERSQQYVPEVKSLEEEALPHGSIPTQKGRCIKNFSPEEEEAELDSSKSSVTPRKWTHRARNES